jgi:TonB-dependent SusC/RagA subfamily outer membrane receptor
MKIRIIFLVLLSALCFNNLTAQKNNKKITITGTVIDATNLPIMNAIIMIDDVKTNSVTDAQGTYKVKVKPTAAKISVFTFGHGTFEDSIKGRTQIDFKFSGISIQTQSEQPIPDGQRGVSTGYGTIKKKNVINETGSIDGTNKKYASYSNMADMITHEISGVRISGNSVIIQDSKNLWGAVYALIVLDGVYMEELPDIPPVNVKSIEVLKGTAAAIYGSRGSGGAVIIKTKLQAE